MPVSRDIKRLQLRGLQHCLIVIFLGLMAGIALTYSALSEVVIWPFFSMPYEMPGDVALWRSAHVGPLLNGALAIVLLLALSLVDADLMSARRITCSLIFMVWANTVFYLIRIWGTNRGLALDSVRYGEGNMFDGIAMLPALIAIFISSYAVLKLVSLASVQLRMTQDKG